MERDAFGRISFHEAQKVIEEYHEERVKKYKLMYPNLTSKAPTTNTIANMNQTTLRKTNAFDNASNTADIFSTSSSSLAEKSSLMKSHFVSTAVAPTTMFQKMKGNNNADLIEVVRIVFISLDSCLDNLLVCDVVDCETIRETFI